MLKVGVLGAGHLGKIHLRLLQQSEKYELVGFYDENPEYAEKIAAEFGYKRFDTIAKLIHAVDVIDIVTPTLSHYKCAKVAIKSGKHVFIEKPLCTTVSEAKKLVDLVEEARIKAMVGHVERFNPALLSLKGQHIDPLFIEVHRLAQFNPRGTEVSVILDLMIHDIDAILSVVKSKVKSINASSVAVISDSPDITNARIEFENGCVANITSSRISMKNMRKSRFFQKDAYISVDYLDKVCEIVRMQDAPEVPGDFDMILQNAEGVKKQIYFDNPNVHANNAILDELETFADAINNNTTPIVTLEDGTEALRVAYQIIDCMNK